MALVGTRSLFRCQQGIIVQVLRCRGPRFSRLTAPAPFAAMSTTSSSPAPAGSPSPGTSGGKPAGLVDNWWGMQNQVQRYGALTQDEGEVDVVILGAGIAGLNTAYNLARNGKSVAVVEARTRGSGQTGRSSAHIMQWHDDFYSHLEGKYGRENLKLIADSQLEAINFIEKAVQEEGIACNFRRLPGYLIPPEINDESAVKQLQQELAACHRAGMDDVQMVDLGGHLSVGCVRQALLFPRSAEFQPLSYINDMAEVLVKKYTVKLFEMSRVARTAMSHDGVVAAQSGGRIKAREAVVLATNSPINHNVAVHARQEAWRTYMLACAVPKGSVEAANWWTAEDIYRYIRLAPSDSQRDVIMIGGGDHITGQMASKYTDVWASLEEYLRRRFPQTQEVVAKWSGQVYEPADELGLYGLDPLNPDNWAGGAAHAVDSAVGGVASSVVPGAEGPLGQLVKRYIITGDSGQGITGGSIAAMVIGDLIMGRPNPWADLYSPSRFKTLLAPSSIMNLGSEASLTASGWVSRAALRNLEDVKGAVTGAVPDLKPGEGAVVQEGAHKVALFRDPKTGELLKHSAVCPHLGCLLSWNPNDTTFDCCCHGSQFTAWGTCINGPACADLEDLGKGGPIAPEPSAA